MMTKIMLVQKHILIILVCIHASFGYDLQNEHCFNFNPDKREQVGILNDPPGIYMNMFPDLYMNQSIRVKNISYYAARAGAVYVSFWKKAAGNKYKLMTKIILSSPGEGIQYSEMENYTFVPQGASLAVHYQLRKESSTKSDKEGVIYYEKSEANPSPSGISVYPVHVKNYMDDGWLEGKTVKKAFRKPSSFLRTPAIHMTICACIPGYYGTDCNDTCSGLCYNDSICDHVDGKCETGCKHGYNFTASQQCEIECEQGTFGDNCENTCLGNCHNDAVCNVENGDCLQCMAGYNFTASAECDKECEQGTYGVNCNETCSGNCFGGEACNIRDGRCASGCSSGYDYSLSPTCNTECRGNTYGLNCTKTCSGKCLSNETCDVRNGECRSGCKPGYDHNKSPSCFEECEQGTYGVNCNGTCSGNCFGGEACNIRDGRCASGCSSGYDYSLSPTCNTECAANRFGLDCKCYCHCMNDTACDNVNGSCPTGCAQGWMGTTCSLSIIDQDTEKGNDVVGGGGSGELVVGIVIAVTIAVVSSIAIAVILIKRYRKRPAKLLGDAPRLREFCEETEILMTEKEAKDEDDDEIADDALYYNQVQNAVTPTLIKVKDFHGTVMKLTAQDMMKEYMSLPKGQTKPWTKAANQELVPKNKFKNILPYDVNRVVLKMIDDDPNSKYINATFIPGHDHGEIKKFIASQGPQKPTIDDFWRMIWQYKVQVVVMLTNLVENMKIKCVQYWPHNGYVTYGGVHLSLIKEEFKTDVVIRHIKATKENETRMLYQIHYVGWPDHDVPTSTSNIFDVLTNARKLNSPNSSIVVHCSAGVGRTGTLISIDYLAEQAKHAQNLDVLECVRKLRNQRVNMVQTLSQYRFIYRAMDEYLTLGNNHIISKANCPEQVEQLLNTSEGQSRLTREFQFLEDTKPKYRPEDYLVALGDINKAKNRNPNIVPTDEHRFRLETEDGAPNDYINAIAIQVPKYKLEYCVSQLPLEGTAMDFWQLLAENNIQNIVILTSEDSSTHHWLPADNASLDVGNCRIICHGSEVTGVCRLSRISVLRINEPVDIDGEIYANVPQPEQTEYANTYQLEAFRMEGRMFMCSAFDVADVEGTIDAIINVHDLMKPHLVAGQPIAVVCRDGASESGIFVACDILSHAFGSQPTIDVFSTVQMIRHKRPQFISDVDEYRLLHAFILQKNQQQDLKQSTPLQE